MHYNMYIHPDLPKAVRWDPQKSDLLKRTRGASFGEVLTGGILDIQRHKTRHHQKVLTVQYQGDIWAIPFIEEDNYLFFKTMYRSRKHRKRFVREDGL